MSLSDPIRRASLVERIRGVLLRPAAEWDKIDLEPATIQSLFTGYAMPLAAIGPVCGAIGIVVFGFGIPGIATYHANPLGAAVTALVSYGLALLATFLVGLIIDALAPTFGGVKNPVQAMKVAVYGSTASWLAGVFGLIPALAVLAIAGLYSLYLYYVGLPKLMKTAPDKALGYTALVVLCYLVLALVIGAVVAPLKMLGAATAGAGGVTVIGDNGVTVTGRDGSTVKVGGALAGLAAAGQAMQAQAAAASAGATTTTVSTPGGAVAAPPEALKALLPLAMSGFTRGEVSAESSAAAGLATSHAQAEYARAGSHIRLEVADMGAMAGLAGLAGSLGVNSTKETSTGYEKVSSGGGRMTTEEYDRGARRGKLAMMVGRIAITAEGEGVSMDELKAAAASVDAGRAAALSKG